MTSRHLLLPALALSALLSGCVGTGPSTQQGAVNGAALGAITGAVIGNNTGSGDGGAGAIIGGLLGAIAGGAAGNAQDHQNGTIYGAQPYPAQTTHHRTYTQVETISVPPQAPRSMPTEQIPQAPSPDAVWIPGYWDYNGSGYVWTAGRWEIPPANSHSYVASHWETRSNANVFVRGYWE